MKAITLISSMLIAHVAVHVWATDLTIENKLDKHVMVKIESSSSFGPSNVLWTIPSDDKLTGALGQYLVYRFSWRDNGQEHQCKIPQNTHIGKWMNLQIKAKGAFSLTSEKGYFEETTHVN